MGERTSIKRARENTVRICERPDCSTVLSIYNKGTICAGCIDKMILSQRPMWGKEL